MEATVKDLEFEILNAIIESGDTPADSIAEIHRHVCEYDDAPDYRLYTDGTFGLAMYSSEIEAFFSKYGHLDYVKKIKRFCQNNDLDVVYAHIVGDVIAHYFLA